MIANLRFKKTLRRMVRETIIKDAIIAEEAKKLLDPIEEPEKTVYKVSIEDRIYWVVAMGNAYTADLQKCIESYENRNFNELRWDYLRPKNIKELDLDEIIDITVDQEGITTSMYDLLFVSKVNNVVHCS